METFNFLVEKNIVKTVKIEAETIEEAKKIFESKLDKSEIDFENEKIHYNVKSILTDNEKKIKEFDILLSEKIDKYCGLGAKIEVIIDNIGYYTYDVKLPVVDKTITDCDNNDILLLNKIFKEIENNKLEEAKSLGMNQKTFYNNIFCFNNFKFNECFTDLQSRVHELKLIDDINIYANIVNQLREFKNDLNKESFEKINSEYEKLFNDNFVFNFTEEEINENFFSIDIDENERDCEDCNITNCIFKQKA